MSGGSAAGVADFTNWEQVAKKPQRTKGMKFIASFSWQRSRSQLIGHGHTQDGTLQILSPE
jgi:hypothetical protein